MSQTKIFIGFLSIFTLCQMTACNSVDCDETPDDPECIDDGSDIDVEKEANTLLESINSFHQFTLQQPFSSTLDTSNSAEIYSFTPAEDSSKQSENDAEDFPEANDLGLTVLAWLDDVRRWEVNNAPFSAIGSIYNEDKSYFLIENGELSNLKTQHNHPTYEAVKKNIFERQLAVDFVWDLGDLHIDGFGKIHSELDVSNKKISKLKNHPDTNKIEILPNADIWGDDYHFDEGAIIYGGTRSVAEDKLIIESIKSNNSFNMTSPNFSNNHDSIDSALADYPDNSPASTHLHYQFSVGYLINKEIYMQFNTTNKTAQIFTSTGDSIDIDPCTPTSPDNMDCQRINVPYIEHLNENYIEIDTSTLSQQRLKEYNLPGYFNPIIAGPFDTAKRFYYGKRYIKTDSDNRIKISPMFLLNDTAKNNVENAFKDWREEMYQD